MTDDAVLSSEELADRRRALRQQRRLRNLISVWRLTVVSGIASGTLWFISTPLWLLQNSHQIVVEGNELLSDQAIQALLPLKYPQPLLAVEPDEVAQQLKAQSPVASASVSRQLFPPRLEVQVQEHHPVAVTIPTESKSATTSDEVGKSDGIEKTAEDLPTYQPGLLDSQGHWMAQTSFIQADSKFTLPELTVRGFTEQYQSQWPSLYQAIQACPVEISEVDWRSSGNLILHTQLGIVHLGSYNSRHIQHQLSTLARLRALTNAKNEIEVEYIDLSNPEAPYIKVVSAPELP